MSDSAGDYLLSNRRGAPVYGPTYTPVLAMTLMLIPPTQTYLDTEHFNTHSHSLTNSLTNSHTHTHTVFAVLLF